MNVMARTRPTRLPAIAAAMLAASASSSSSAAASASAQQCVASAAAFAAAHLPSRHRGHRGRHLRVRTLSPCDGGCSGGGLPSSSSSSSSSIRDDEDYDDDLDSTRGNDDGEDDRDADDHHRDYKAFVDDVVSFLDGDGVTHRPMSREELRRVLERHFSFDDDDGGGGGSGAVVVESRSKEGRVGGAVDETLALLGRDVFLVVGNAASAPASNGEGARRYSFALHLCPIPDLEAMLTSHRRHLRRRRHYPEEADDDDGDDYDEEDDPSTTTSRAVAAHAWLNARVTNAFSSGRRLGDGGDDDNDGGRTPTSVVHLHRDVWQRSRSIVISRLRGKCGMHRRRYYARRTDARRIDKSEYAPFLAEHHLWGAIGAKYAYGLFARDRRRDNDDNDDGGITMPEPGDIIAAATFSSGRTITRSGRVFRSFELLRFCTAKDVTVVGGLTKLISAFAKDVRRRGNGDQDGQTATGMDVVTSIDRDFGCGDAWPNFVSVDVMDPVPMFVGDVDGARRHAVGAGLTPLEQPRRRRRMGDDGDLSTKTLSVTIASSGVLRAGLPDSLLRELGEGGGGALGTKGVCDRNDRRDDPWRIAARRGFHPVFDAGVERLMSVVVYGGGGIVFVDGDDDDGTKSGPSPVELWLASTPRYARDHYSSNPGVRDMLGCIRSARLKK